MRCALFALVACLSCDPASRYRPVRAGLGYDELRTSDRSFEVRFESGSRSEAHMGALRRAAELTLANGYFGFVAHVDDHQENVTVRRRALIGHARSVSDMTVIAIDMLSKDEFKEADVPQGATLYEAALMMRETDRMDVGAHPWDYPRKKRRRTEPAGVDHEDPAIH